MSSSIALLPTELQCAILQFLATGSASEQISNLIALSQTCHNLHHAVFCEKNDSVWRSPALELGISSSVTLENIIYPGSSTLQKRHWLNVLKLNYLWLRPFDSTNLRLQKAFRSLPPQERNGDWFGRRTIELVVLGEGTQKRPGYHAKHALPSSGGSAIFRISGGKKDISAVLDPALNRVTTVGSQSPKKWSFTPFPCGEGYVVEETNSGTRVREYNESFSRYWDLGQQSVDRFVSNGNFLVAIAFLENRSPQNATKLFCVQYTGDNSNIADSLWEIDVPVDWRDDDADNRYAYAHLKNFHMTSTHVVCLITRHPDERLGKLTRTEFIVLDLKTGKIVRKFKVNTEASNPGTGTSQRAPFTTAFKHDFLLTDMFIISGGPGGGLFVWDYSGQRSNHFLYTIPNPWALEDSPNTEIPRQYSDLTMSVDGRYVAATTSEQLLIFDMVTKELHGAYSNGRKVGKEARYIKNPMDDFPGGLWCWFKDWKRTTCKQTGDIDWEEVGGGVAYLTELSDHNVATCSIFWNHYYLQGIIVSLIYLLVGNFAFMMAVMVVLAARVYFRNSTTKAVHTLW